MNAKFLLFSVLITSAAKAQINTDRPSASASSTTIGYAAVQLETGLVYNKYSNYGVIVESYYLPEYLLKYGVGENLEIRYSGSFISAEWLGYQKISGFGLNTLGFKYKVHTSAHFQWAVISEIVLPIKTKLVIERPNGIKFTGCFSYDFNERNSIGSNFGFAFSPNSVFMNNTLYFNHAFSPKIRSFIELYGRVGSIDNYGYTNYFLDFDAGLTYAILDNQQLDFSFGAGINEPTNYFALGYSVLLRRPKSP